MEKVWSLFIGCWSVECCFTSHHKFSANHDETIFIDLVELKILDQLNHRIGAEPTSKDLLDTNRRSTLTVDLG